MRFEPLLNTTLGFGGEAQVSAYAAHAKLARSKLSEITCYIFHTFSLSFLVITITIRLAFQAASHSLWDTDFLTKLQKIARSGKFFKKL